MRRDNVVAARVVESYRIMLEFFGLQLAEETTGRVEKRPTTWRARFRNLDRHTHNAQRITLILRGLGQMGFRRYIPALLAVLEPECTLGHLGQHYAEACSGPWREVALGNRADGPESVWFSGRRPPLARATLGSSPPSRSPPAATATATDTDTDTEPPASRQSFMEFVTADLTYAEPPPAHAAAPAAAAAAALVPAAVEQPSHAEPEVSRRAPRGGGGDRGGGDGESTRPASLFIPPSEAEKCMLDATGRPVGSNVTLNNGKGPKGCVILTSC